MDREDLKKHQARKRLLKVQEAIKDILQPIYALSSEVFAEAKKRFDDYRTAQGVPANEALCSPVTDDIIKQLFADWEKEIVTRSRRIGSRAIRDYSLSIAVEAWIFCRRNIIKNRSQIQGVPIVWKAVDEFFQQFVDEAQMQALTEMDKEDQRLEEADKKLEEIREATEAAKGPPKPKGVLDFEAGLAKIRAEQESDAKPEGAEDVPGQPDGAPSQE